MFADRRFRSARLLWPLLIVGACAPNAIAPPPGPDAAPVYVPPGAGGAGGAGGVKPPHARGGAGGGQGREDGAGEAGTGGSVVDAAVPVEGRPPDAAPASCLPRPSVPPGPLRRLTTAQYRRTVLDLTGAQALTITFPEERTEEGFEDRAALQEVTLAHVQAWDRAAAQVANDTAARLAANACLPGDPEETCISNFVSALAPMAYRRSVVSDEREVYQRLYREVRKLGAPIDGYAAVVRLFLQSAPFLYRVELGRPNSPTGGLTHYEIASRLSYLIWGSMPDSRLFGYAAGGMLSHPDALASETRRLLASPKARDGIGDFFRQWLSLDRVLSVKKDPKLFPVWQPALAPSMREEARLFIERVIFDGDARLSTLLTAPETMANASLARLYGVPGVDSETFAPVKLDPAQRAGLLTQGWFLAGLGNESDSGPGHRGGLIRERLLCQPIPAHPIEVGSGAPTPMPGKTTRELYEAGINTSSCRACHSLIEPVGFAFENYDSTGAYRTLESGKPIDASGVLAQTDVDGAFKNGVELSALLARSAQVQSCVARRFYESALGRLADDVDRCTLAELDRTMAATGGDLKEMLVALVRNDAFRAINWNALLIGDPPAPSSPSGAAAQDGDGYVPPLTFALTDPGALRAVDRLITDGVAVTVQRLSQQVTNTADRRRLDEHLSALRELERSRTLK